MRWFLILLRLGARLYWMAALRGDMVKRNKKRQFRQRIGLGFLMLSFVLAGFSVVLN
jgi:hypothetical protein